MIKELPLHGSACLLRPSACCQNLYDPKLSKNATKVHFLLSISLPEMLADKLSDYFGFRITKAYCFFSILVLDFVLMFMGIFIPIMLMEALITVSFSDDAISPVFKLIS